jgi:hypothetical protein
MLLCAQSHLIVTGKTVGRKLMLQRLILFCELDVLPCDANYCVSLMMVLLLKTSFAHSHNFVVALRQAQVIAR